MTAMETGARALLDPHAMRVTSKRDGFTVEGSVVDYREAVHIVEGLMADCAKLRARIDDALEYATQAEKNLPGVARRIRAALTNEGGNRMTSQNHEDRAGLIAAIGHEAVPLSIRDHPEITSEFRTAKDRDGLVERILAAGFSKISAESAWDEGYNEAEHYERNNGDTVPTNPYRAQS